MSLSPLIVRSDDEKGMKGPLEIHSSRSWPAREDIFAQGTQTLWGVVGRFLPQIGRDGRQLPYEIAGQSANREARRPIQCSWEEKGPAAAARSGAGKRPDARRVEMAREERGGSPCRGRRPPEHSRTMRSESHLLRPCCVCRPQGETIASVMCSISILGEAGE
jgi:hypothetical protein